MILIDPLYSSIVQWTFGLLLLGTAWHKLRGLQEFQAIIRDYRLLPDFGVWPIALLLVTVEALLGSAWLLLPYQALIAGLSSGLVGMYALAIAINLLRGRQNIDCGCHLGLQPATAARLSWWLVLRNAGLAGLAFLPLLPQSARELGVLDGVSVMATLLLITLLLLALGQLRANHQAIRYWKAARD